MNKFDVCYTNPPYTGAVDQKILSYCLENKLIDHIICIHPVGFLLLKETSMIHVKKSYTKVLKFNPYLKKVIFRWYHSMFKIQQKQVMGITVWYLNKTDDDVQVDDRAFNKGVIYNTKIQQIFVHSPKIKETIKVYNRFKNCDSILAHVSIFNPGEKITCKFPIMHGDIKQNDQRGFSESFFAPFYKTQLSIRENDICPSIKEGSSRNYNKCYPIWYFKTEQQRQNFIKYSKTKCFRFLLSLTKWKHDVLSSKVYSIIPWMDFTKSYTDADLVKLWDLQDLWDYIDKFIPDYFDDYKTNIRGNI